MNKTGMVCGGTGITPMYQVIQAILADPADTTQLQMVYANVDPNSIILYACHPQQNKTKHSVVVCFR
jgi:NAD(P)H-flavin reductase